MHKDPAAYSQLAIEIQLDERLENVDAAHVR